MLLFQFFKKKTFYSVHNLKKKSKLSSPKPSIQTHPKALFASLEGGCWRALGKRDWGVFIFLRNTKSPQNGGTQKLYCMKILDGLDNFFKSNPWYDNTHKIKNVLIIIIHLSFSTKPLSQKRWKISQFSSLLLSFQSLLLPFPRNSQLEPKNYFHIEKLLHNI